MIVPLQIRAARALLGWSQSALAERAKIGLATLQRIESAQGDAKGNVQTFEKLERTLRDAGILFLNQDATHGPGVRLRLPLP